MTTADWALIISLVSLLTSIAGFVWNVWSKFIYPKARLQVDFAIVRVFPEPSLPQRFARLLITNHGPGEVIIESSMVRTKRSWWKRDGWALLNPIHDLSDPSIGVGPFGGGLPKRLAVAENFSLFYPYKAETFLREPLTSIGVNDSFGRKHWAPRHRLRAAIERFAIDFEGQPSG